MCGLMPMRALLAVLAVLLAGGVCASPQTQPSTLVFSRSPSFLSTHSGLLFDLKNAGHQLTFAQPRSIPDVFVNGDRVFDNLLLVSPKTSEFSEASLRAFVDDGGSILIAVSGEPSFAVRQLANAAGFDFDHSVHDPANIATSDDVIYTTSTLNSTFVLDARAVHQPIAFRGVGQVRLHTTTSTSSSSFASLTASPTAFSTSASGAIETLGTEVLLVTSTQARNNARITFTGSPDLLSDEFAHIRIGGLRTENRAFARSIALWTFQQKGVLRASNMRHHKLAASASALTPSQYTLNDTVQYSIDLDVFDAERGGWRAFTGDDVQLELVMMDPYIRAPLRRTGTSRDGHTGASGDDSTGASGGRDSSRFSCALTLPDVYGVFKFHVQYERQGLSRVQMSTVIPVHPVRHDEFERFIPAAFPYYASAFSMLAGFFLFGVVFMYHDEK